MQKKVKIMGLGNWLRFAAAVGVTAITLANAANADEWSFAPAVGAAVPVGDFGERWSVGYALGLTTLTHFSADIDWGFEVEFQRYVPDAAAMVKLNGRELKIQESHGWNTVTQTLLAARKYLASGSNGRFWAGLGAGIAYQSSKAVRVVGYYPYGSSVINREINRPGTNEWAPALSLAIGADIFNSVKPSINYQHAFLSDPAGRLVFSLALSAR